MKCGFWLDIQIVIEPSGFEYSARIPLGSIGVGARRCWRMRCLTTTSASFIAAGSSGMYARSHPRLSGAPEWALGLLASSALLMSMTAGSCS